MCCVKTGCTVPRREPSTPCSDQTRGNWWLYVEPVAGILLAKYGVNPCDVPQAGGDDTLRRQDAEGYLKQRGYVQ